MRVDPLLLLSLLITVSAGAGAGAGAAADFQLVGTAQCTDCKNNHFNTFAGLHVTIDCKLKNGDIKRFGSGELDGNGGYKISIPHEIIQKHDCYPQLHSAAAIPCPAHATKIIFTNDAFSPTETLKFASALCNSKFYWTHPKSSHPWLKNFGHHWSVPPLYKHKHIFPPIFHKPPPVYTPPTPVPVDKPPPIPVPVYKPPPVKKPCPPVPKPKPPVKKPCPPVAKPPVKTKPPVITKPLPPAVPVHPPVITKPLPPVIPVHPLLPPFKKKPCPPLLPKLPPFPPKIHPKFGHLPPLSPAIPQP